MHKIQMTILRELLFRPNAKFRDINSSKTSSDQFSYHLNVLIESGYVVKGLKGYSLTIKGKEYANTMDTDTAKIEKQPKIAVMVVGRKKIDGKEHFLVQRRTKEPYFGYVGFITGKIRYGEKLFETAKRELEEESGLTCDNFVLKDIFHDLVYKKDTQELLEDKFFFLIFCDNPTGELKSTESGEMSWVSEEDFYKIKEKYYNEEAMFESLKSGTNPKVSEESYYIEAF